MRSIHTVRFVLVLTGLLLVAGAGPAFGQGADDCTNAQVIAGDGVFDFDNRGATTDGGLDCLGNGFTGDVWFAWTAPVTGTATLETCGRTSLDTIVAAYDDLPCPPSPNLACNDDGCARQSRMSWPVAAGTTYLLRIGGYAGRTGTGMFTIVTPLLFGACCLADGTCMEMTNVDCAANNGTFQGDGTTCAGSCFLLSSGFTYQGQLNLSGAPLNDSADFEFSLWDAGGNMIGGVAAIDDVMVVDGLFTVELNSGGEFGPNAFDGHSRWLEIAVRSPAGGGAFTTLTPRQPLTATPYSTFAQTAQNLAGTVFVDAGNVGIGTREPAGKLDVAGNNHSFFGGLRLNGLDGFVNQIFQSNSGETLGITANGGPISFGQTSSQQMILTAGGNVGIGTTDPSEALEVVGTVTATAFVGDGSGLTGISGDDLGDHTATQNIATNGHWFSNDGDDEGVFIDGAGNVGIGTTDPSEALEVVGTVTATAFVGDGSGLTGISGDDLGDHTATQNIATNGHWLSNDGDNEGVFIDGVGNVGIGELSPSATLDVVGTTELNGDVTINSNLTVDTDTLFVDGAAGQVGIGTNSPESLFQVRSKPIDSGAFNAETTAGALLKSLNDNGGNIPAAPEAALILAREGVRNESFANYARFDLSRYEDADFFSRTQLDLRLSHGRLDNEGNNTPTILTLQSGGNVGIGEVAPGFPLNFATTLGDKISLFGLSGNHYGFGIQDSTLQIHTDVSTSDIVFGYGESASMTETMRIKGDGTVGIGRNPTDNSLEVEGNASKSTGGMWSVNSDRRIKTDIQTIDSALDTLDKVRLVSFEYTDDYKASHQGVSGGRYLNVIAQEFAEVFPDHVKGSGEKLPDGSEILQVDTYPLTIYSAAAIQELRSNTDRRLAEKDAEIEALRNANAALVERMERLESIVDQLSSK